MTVAAMAALCVPLYAQTAPSPNNDLAQQVVHEIAEVKSGATPAQWLQTHLDEKLQRFNGEQYANDTQHWCVRTVVARGAASRHWTRSVYFYDPQPPEDDALPALGARTILETSCQLGLLWINIPEANPAVGTKLTEDIQAALASQYGSGSMPSRLDLGGFGSAGWTTARQWNVDGAVITVAYDQFKGQPHRTLVRMAFANSDAIHDLGNETKHARTDLMARIDELVRKVKETGLPAQATTDMLTLLQAHDYFNGQNPPSGAEIVAALRGWLTAAKSQPAAQQALALLTADRVLDFLGPRNSDVGDPVRAELKSLGADYVHDELAGADVYAHSLLKEAQALAPPGPSADEVLLFQMERGFDDTGMCSAGEEEFLQVIHEGESLLAGARSLPTSTLASLHFMVGDAYATIAWLAKSTVGGYNDPTKYQPMEESARAKALDHYRAAFRLEHGTPRAQKAWKQGWRLAAGLTPTSGRYFCVYD